MATDYTVRVKPLRSAQVMVGRDNEDDTKRLAKAVTAMLSQVNADYPELEHECRVSIKWRRDGRGFDVTAWKLGEKQSGRS
jgi:hypothetical protein